MCLLCGAIHFIVMSRKLRTSFPSQRRDWRNSLFVYLNRMSPSPNSSFFPSRPYQSLDLFLQSCNLSFARDACSMLHFQPSSMHGASSRKGCLWGRLATHAGLGHQLTEMLFYAQLAHVYMLPHVYEPFSSVKSSHLSSYDWAVDFFGLESTFRSLGSKVAKSASVIDEPLESCDRYLRPGSTECDDSLTHSIEEFQKSSGNCFKSPLMYKLFANFAPCLRQSSMCYGNWVAQARSVQYDPSVVNVAWHIRVGDINLYNSSSSYFRQVLSFVAFPALHTSPQGGSQLHDAVPTRAQVEALFNRWCWLGQFTSRIRFSF
jgi:hypothetical protein